MPWITAIGASLLLQNSFQGFFGSQNRGYLVPPGLEGNVEVLGGSSQPLGFDIAKVQLLTIAIGIVSVIVLTLFVAKSRTGRSMRASPRIARSPS